MTAQAPARLNPVLASLGVLTVVSGIADAISYLGPGHVFVANMTGNVVFIGFGAAGAGQLSVPASLVALAGFLLGSLAGGRLGRAERGAAHRLGSGVAIQLVLLAAAAGIRSQRATPAPRAMR